MARKLTTVLVLSLLLFAFLAVNSFGMAGKANHNVKKVGSVNKAKLAGAESGIGQVTPNDGETLGFDEIRASLSPGKEIGITTYDYQGNGRMNRQIGARGSEMVHFTWMKQTTDILLDDRGTGYNAWDPDVGVLIHNDVGGGCDIHPRLGAGVNYSGYVGLDVDTEGKVNISNHHNEGAGYAATIWYDFSPAACFFAPFRSRLPDTTQSYIEDEDDEFEYIWPSHEYQVVGADTVTHLFAHQSKDGIQPQVVAYFRRLGSDTIGYWDYPPMPVDTVSDIAQMVTASPVSQKVALAWIANIPEIQGDPESSNTGSQRANDLFVAYSDDMGATWGNAGSNYGLEKYNVTQNATDEGWFLHTDISALYGTDDYLHVIWNAREVIPVGTGTYTHFYGCRLFHYSNDPSQSADPVRVIKDANWDLPTTNWCYGGAWNEMSIVKMSISECENKFYATFTQYNDIAAGITDDCHEDAFTGGVPSSANGEIFVSVSDNGGFNWDIARNLTDSYTSHCQDGGLECDADMWMSAARFGIENIDGDFFGVPVVDPSDGAYTGNHFLDIVYVNDKYGGGCVQDAGVWTTNPVKWFRVKCVDPVPNPVLSTSPTNIGDPTWTKYNQQLDTTVRLENIGNAPLTVSTITPAYVNGSGWLGVANSGPVVISHLTPNFYELDVYLNFGGVVGGTTAQRMVGYLVMESDALGGSTDSLPIVLIVADTLQFPETADIRTECVRINWNNAGNIGNGGNLPDGLYNLNFFDDCDTTGNGSGSHDNSAVYLYESSPFVLRIDGTDTLLSYYMFNADWLSLDGLRPLEGLVADSTTYTDYQYGYTGKMVTQDSSIAIEVEYFAPTSADSCNFIVVKQKFYNNSGSAMSGVYLGDLFDWDIPSDSGVANGSGFDAPGGESSLDLMYVFGGEYGADEDPNNDCVLADDRVGGMSYYNGYKYPYCPDARPFDSLNNPIGPWWTHMNPAWITATGGFVGSQLYNKMESMGSGFETWEATGDLTNPDSMFQDLNMVASFGKFDLGAEDTLYFVKILASTYEGVSALQADIAKANQWIADRPDIFSWPTEYQCTCCDLAGDASDNGAVNILDITYLIAYLYQSGPQPPCMSEGDASGNNTINILDITYLIAYLYQSGPAPICGTIDK